MTTTETEDKTYNGWTNYETWLVKLWTDNEYAFYLRQTDLANEAREVPIDDPFDLGITQEQASLRWLEEAYRDMVKEWVYGDEPPACLATDLLGAALSEVNWREIAEALLDD